MLKLGRLGVGGMLGLLGLTLAACGSSGNGSSSAPTTTTTAACRRGRHRRWSDPPKERAPGPGGRVPRRGRSRSTEMRGSTHPSARSTQF